MVTEHDKTLEVLRIAIQMETDGKKYYQMVSQRCRNPVFKELFHSLADEEVLHQQEFEEIYNAIRIQKAWPETSFKPDKGERLRTLFAKVTEELGGMQPPATHLEALQVAMNMENKTHDFYKSQGKKAIYDAERDFYRTLAAEERQHYLVLLDYYEYLKDPAGWFVQKEHPSLDGG